MSNKSSAKPIEVEGAEYASARHVIAAAREDESDVAIRLQGKDPVVRRGAADRLAGAGVSSAYPGEHRGPSARAPDARWLGGSCARITSEPRR